MTVEFDKEGGSTSSNPKGKEKLLFQLCYNIGKVSRRSRYRMRVWLSRMDLLNCDCAIQISFTLLLKLIL